MAFFFSFLQCDALQCSATCGTGAQRREVKCLDSNQTVSHLCREDDRPSARQACSHSRVCSEGNQSAQSFASLGDADCFALDYRLPWNVHWFDLNSASEEDATTREAQDTPIVSGEDVGSVTQRNGSEPVEVAAKVHKLGKSSKSRSKVAVTTPPPPAPAATGESPAIADPAGKSRSGRIRVQWACFIQIGKKNDEYQSVHVPWIVKWNTSFIGFSLKNLCK